MPSWFDSCDDSCGWVAAIVSAVAYGSFGVPIKETVHLDAHPLVLQSYKTGTMFLTCWLVLTLGVQVMWTRWGLLSGLLWVLGGCGGIYAIRMAGMAIAVGCWASVMIIVNFVWGILVFREPVADFWGTVGAFSLLVLGLLGMSRYSAPTEKGHDDGLNNDHIITPLSDNLCSSESSSENPYKSLNPAKQNIRQRGDKDASSTAADPEDGLVRNGDGDDDSAGSLSDNVSELVVLFGVQMSKRRAGLLGAIFNGVMTGSSLVPLHYAKAEGFGGANFMISFASGALIANALVWAVFFAHRWMKLSVTDMAESTRLHQVYASLPGFHFRELWLPGFAAGILLSIAMFGSILSTTYLGQGVGNSIVQSKILISGLWGIFWYREITGCERVSKWFGAAILTVIGILWLSYERIAAKEQSGNHRFLETLEQLS